VAAASFVAGPGANGEKTVGCGAGSPWMEASR